MNLQSNAQAHRRLSVFLVEDSRDDAFFFQRAVSRSGVDCDVTHFWDGQSAVELLDKFQLQGTSPTMPDLMFLDLKMPRLNGFEVLHWIREAKLQNRVNVIVLSGSDDREDRHRAGELGASNYIVKPISPAALEPILRHFNQPAARRTGERSPA